MSIPYFMSRVNSGTSTLCFASRDLAPGDEVKHVSCVLDLLMQSPPVSCNCFLPPRPPPVIASYVLKLLL